MLLENEEILGGIDPRDLAKASSAAAELGSELLAAKERVYVRKQIRKVRFASLSDI